MRKRNFNHFFNYLFHRMQLVYVPVFMENQKWKTCFLFIFLTEIKSTDLMSQFFSVELCDWHAISNRLINISFSANQSDDYTLQLIRGVVHKWWLWKYWNFNPSPSLTSLFLFYIVTIGESQILNTPPRKTISSFMDDPIWILLLENTDLWLDLPNFNSKLQLWLIRHFISCSFSYHIDKTIQILASIHQSLHN